MPTATEVRAGFDTTLGIRARVVHGDLKVTTDFRTIYATLLERVLDTDSRGALGRKFTGINFM